MKKFNFIALAIIGIYACFNFTSCSKDEKDEPSKPEASVKMRPTSISWENEGRFKIYYENIKYFEGTKVKSYKMTSIENYFEFDEVFSFVYENEYTYTENTIINKIKRDDYSEEIVYKLKDGLIIYSNDISSGSTFEYENNHLVLKDEGPEDKLSFKWENGNLIQENYDGYNGYTYIYNDYPLYTWIPLSDYSTSILDDIIYEDCNHFLIMGGYYGQISNNLLMMAKDLYNYTDSVLFFDYEFNEYGYPTKMIMDYSDGGIITGNIEWEKY